MNELSQEAQVIVDAVGDADFPTTADRKRVRAALFAQLGLATAASGTAAAVAGKGSGANPMNAAAVDVLPATAVGTSKIALGLKILAGMVIIGTLGLGGYWLSQSGKTTSEKPVLTAAEDDRAKAAHETIPTPTVEAIVETPEPEAKIPEAVAPEQPAPAPAKKPVSKPPTTDTPADPLAALREEKELISKAKRALDAGQSKLALKVLAKHSARFKNGVLAQDRAGLRVLALCALGQMDRARREAARFLKRWPRASMAQRVRNACK